MSEGGQWGAVRNGVLWPRRVVMAVCRGKRLAAIRQGVVQGPLTLPADTSPQQMAKLLNKLGREKWNVDIRERYPPGPGVVVYLARYLRGGPLSQRRLLACASERVVVRDEERAKGPGGQATQRTMRLPWEPFLGRWLLHGPPPRAVLVRGWGLYAHSQSDARAQCRVQVGQGLVETPPHVEGQAEELGDAPLERCPVCRQPLVCTTRLPRAGIAPPRAAGWEQVA